MPIISYPETSVFFLTFSFLLIKTCEDYISYLLLHDELLKFSTLKDEEIVFLPFLRVRKPFNWVILAHGLS